MENLAKESKLHGMRMLCRTDAGNRCRTSKMTFCFGVRKMQRTRHIRHHTGMLGKNRTVEAGDARNLDDPHPGPKQVPDIIQKKQFCLMERSAEESVPDIRDMRDTRNGRRR